MSIDFHQISAFAQVVLIDLTLAGDNAIVVGMAAAGLAREDRRRAIMAGIGVATLLRIALALVAAQFLAILGLTLAGGLLLLWVAWKMFREITGAGETQMQAATGAPRKTVRQALIQIVAADISMSVDNVLAVAAAARAHPSILVAGLALSVGLMGVASTLVARLLGRFPWIVWLGLGVITYVSLSMIYLGWHQLDMALLRL